jgi:hypothetical protein
VDIGFIGARYPLFIGDVERRELFRGVEERAKSLGLDIDTREQNVPRTGWAAFLATSRGTLGAEAGSYFLDRRGEIIANAKEYLRRNPSATFDDVRERCFTQISVPYVSGKAISSRHFEAAGTRTCQILLEGDYNGILQADEHYIAVKKDCSNLDEALERFSDEAYRMETAERAYDHVLSEHTYAHRVRSLLDAIT